ncbi:MAG: hypothetical protein IJT19_04600 [Bacteroidaceae bacterium]|nr:hypothetical protein [Bacteroidaceae bacterium]
MFAGSRRTGRNGAHLPHLGTHRPEGLELVGLLLLLRERRVSQTVPAHGARLLRIESKQLRTAVQSPVDKRPFVDAVQDTYTLDGKPIATDKLYKGIYITNGKKILIKQ